jgi:tRNA 2-thiocytidine biosynthesis protein TtcA
VGQCISDYGLIEPGDRVMVCISGGKDSYGMLELLLQLRRRSPVPFTLVAVNIDQGWPGYRTDIIEAYLRQRQAAEPFEIHMERVDIAEAVDATLKPGVTPCSLCSRLRRGVLYSLAPRLGCTKIALGHHADDMVETLLLNLFFAGQLAAMPPRLAADDGVNVVIRPLAYVSEARLMQLSAARSFPLVACGCPVCGLPEQQRQQMKRLLASLESTNPGIKTSMLAALRNVRMSQLWSSPQAGRTQAVPPSPSGSPSSTPGNSTIAYGQAEANGGGP